jgi:hypothetical protein
MNNSPADGEAIILAGIVLAGIVANVVVSWTGTGDRGQLQTPSSTSKDQAGDSLRPSTGN